MRIPVVLLILACVAPLAFGQSKPSIAPIKDFQGKTVEFGPRMHPILKVERDHNGIDFNCPEGTPVLATADGKVLEAGPVEKYGIVIRLQSGPSIKTFYAHLADVSVKVGQVVHQGEVIGHSGNTGLTAGPHLHYEIIENGIPKNPRLFLAQR